MHTLHPGRIADANVLEGQSSKAMADNSIHTVPGFWPNPPSVSCEQSRHNPGGHSPFAARADSASALPSELWGRTAAKCCPILAFQVLQVRDPGKLSGKLVQTGCSGCWKTFFCALEMLGILLSGADCKSRFRDCSSWTVVNLGLIRPKPGKGSVSSVAGG